jgi:hypothetical protein
MLWIGAALTLVAGVIGLMFALFAKRPIAVEHLGSVSQQWIASHRVEPR